MNGDATFNELVRLVKAAPAPVKEAVRIVATSNDAIRPDYMPAEVKTRLALAAS